MVTNVDRRKKNKIYQLAMHVRQFVWQHFYVNDYIIQSNILGFRCLYSLAIDYCQRNQSNLTLAQ